MYRFNETSIAALVFHMPTYPPLNASSRGFTQLDAFRVVSRLVGLVTSDDPRFGDEWHAFVTSWEEEGLLQAGALRDVTWEANSCTDARTPPDILVRPGETEVVQ